MRQIDEFGSFFLLDHPLIQHKLTLMRERHQPTSKFRALLKEIAMLMGYEITRDLPLRMTSIETPVAPCDAPKLSGKKLVVVPILRAGLGMADGLLDLLPSARVGHIGLYRDPATLQPVEYVVKLPAAAAERDFILVDPMLATGGSAAHAVDILYCGAAPIQRGSELHGAGGRARRCACVSRAPSHGTGLCRRRSTAISTITAISCPAWATRATVFSARVKPPPIPAIGIPALGTGVRRAQPLHWMLWFG